MKKNSPFTRFISYKITKLAETGITNNLSKRYEISEPNCKPTQVKGQNISKLSFIELFFPEKNKMRIAISIWEKRHYERFLSEIF